MTHLFYSSTAIYRSYLLLLDEAEQVLQTGGTPLFLVCDGSHTSFCFGNVSGSRITCRLCRYMRKQGLAALSRRVECFTVRDLLHDSELQCTRERTFEYRTVADIYGLRYKDVDIGYAALSHYIVTTRNHIPALTSDLRRVLDGFLRTSVFLTDAIDNLLRARTFQSASLFNGRTFDTRPVLRKCVAAGIQTNVFELIGFGEQAKKVCFPNSLPQNVAMQGRWILAHWDKAVAKDRAEAERIGRSFFEKRRSGVPAGDRVHTRKQRKDMVPANWDATKTNIVFFVSSEDEYVAIDAERDANQFVPTQIDGVRKILTVLLDQGGHYHLYVRIHPNLEGVPFAYHTDFYTLEKEYPNVTVLAPDSPVSTYALLDHASKVVVYSSTVGIEAVYWGKPVILIGHGCYRDLGGCYIPKDDADLKRFLTTDLAAADQLPAIKYGYSVLGDVGTPFRHFDFTLFWPDIFLRKVIPNRRFRAFLVHGMLPFFRWISRKTHLALGNSCTRSLRNASDNTRA